MVRYFKGNITSPRKFPSSDEVKQGILHWSYVVFTTRQPYIIYENLPWIFRFLMQLGNITLYKYLLQCHTCTCIGKPQKSNHKSIYVNHLTSNVKKTFYQSCLKISPIKNEHLVFFAISDDNLRELSIVKDWVSYSQNTEN